MAKQDPSGKDDPLSAETLEKAAFDYLGRYMASTEMLRRVLARKVMRASFRGAVDEDDAQVTISQTITRCKELGLLDDQRFADASAASLVRRGASSRAILAKLAQKGVDRETAQSAVNRMAQQTDGNLALVSAARLAERRRLGPYRLADRELYRDRDLAVMARAGHSFGVAISIIDAEDRTDVQQAIAESVGEP
jgi:regulatory protein